MSKNFLITVQANNKLNIGGGVIINQLYRSTNYI